jgi:hypothetical protein
MECLFFVPTTNLPTKERLVAMILALKALNGTTKLLQPTTYSSLFYSAGFVCIGGQRRESAADCGCTTAVECNDDNSCTIDTCNKGVCNYAFLDVGTAVRIILMSN